MLHDVNIHSYHLCSFLANRTARSMIGYWHDHVVCLSVCPSICLWHCALAKRYIIQQNCMNKWTISALPGTRCCNFCKENRRSLRSYRTCGPLFFILLILPPKFSTLPHLNLSSTAIRLPRSPNSTSVANSSKVAAANWVQNDEFYRK